MSEPNASNVVAGSGLLYVAPLGTSLPTIGSHGEYPVSWPMGWVAVGYTDDGINLTYAPTVKEIMVDEEAAPVDDVLATEKFTVSSKLAEATLANLQNAITACTYSDNSASSEVIQIAIGSKPINYMMIGVQGPAPAGPQGTAALAGLQRIVIVQKAIAKASVGIKIQRKDKVVIPVSFEARKISGTDLVDIYDILQGAS